MPKDINLLPDITLEEEKQEKRRKLFTMISIGIILIGVVIILAVYTIDITLSQTEKKLITENEEREKITLSFAEIEFQQRVISAKLKAAEKIINSAKNFKQIFEQLESVRPQNGIAYQSIAIDAKNKMNLSIKATNSEFFREYINNLLNQEKGGKYFEQIDLSGVTSNKDGTLQFTITMSIKKDEETK